MSREFANKALSCLKSFSKGTSASVAVLGAPFVNQTALSSVDSRSGSSLVVTISKIFSSLEAAEVPAALLWSMQRTKKGLLEATMYFRCYCYYMRSSKEECKICCNEKCSQCLTRSNDCSYSRHVRCVLQPLYKKLHNCTQTHVTPDR